MVFKRKNITRPSPADHKLPRHPHDGLLRRLQRRTTTHTQIYGAQPPNELLRQAIDSGGFYDTQKLFFKGIKDVVFLSACAPPGGGRNEVSPRLLRHFSMVWLTALSTGSLNRIFQAVLGGFLQAIVPALTDLTEPLVAASVKIYERIASELLPTPAKSHYTFNLRDLSKVYVISSPIGRLLCRHFKK